MNPDHLDATVWQLHQLAWALWRAAGPVALDTLTGAGVWAVVAALLTGVRCGCSSG